MEENKKSGLSLKVVVIILLLVILCLVGYIVFTNVSGFGKNNVVVDSFGLFDISKLSGYMNYDGTYATVKTVSFVLEDENRHDISFDMEGKVYLGHYVLRKDITNVSKVVDIVGFQSETLSAEDSICYILTNEGKVYKYSIADYLDGTFEAKLVENVKNAKRIVSYSVASSEDASSNSGVMVILKNGEYVKLV